MWRYPVLVMVLVCAGFAPVAAQAKTQLQPGDRVRFADATDRGVFEVAEWGDSGLVVRDRASGMRIPISPAEAERLQVRRGHEPLGHSVLRGMGIGLLAGAATGAVMGYMSGDDDQAGLISFTAEEKALILGTVLGGGGAVVGGVIGAVAPRSRWEPVHPGARISVVPARGGGVGVVLSRRF